KLVKYDWETGKPGAEVPLKNRAATIELRDGSMFVFNSSGSSQPLVTRVNPSTGESKTEDTVPTPLPSSSLAAASPQPPPGPGPGLDPSQAAGRFSGFGPFAAAQAVALQSQVRQEKMLAMMKEDEAGAPAMSRGLDSTRSSLIPAGRNVVEFSVKLIEEKSERRQAMKAPPKLYALYGPITQPATAAIANETLNEMQRERTEGVEIVDVSRYQITLRRLPAEDAPDWTGEVIGPAQFFALETVDLLVAGTTLLVF